MRKTLLLKQGTPSVSACPPGRARLFRATFVFFLIAFLINTTTVFAQTKITGTVIDETNLPLPGVAVRVRGTTIGTATDGQGKFTLDVPANAVLDVTFVGYATQQVTVGTQTTIKVTLKAANENLQEVVVTGYGTQKRESVTGSIASVTSKDIDRVHGGATVSTTLAGKIPGVTFRMADGRPGASANIQIRNMGAPLYVIDGIQQDAGQFNNLAPNDIESISVLKDASAAIYGVRAANGVVVVTTKKGSGESRINVDAYMGLQNWFRFPDVVRNSYDYAQYKVDAQVNSNQAPMYTPEQLEKFKVGTERGYQSFDWREYVLGSNPNAPQNSVNVNFTGGAEKVNYYVSATNFFQNSNLGKEYEFGRTNIQSNISAKVANGFRVSANINGRVESRENPGVPGGDDYFLARFAVLRNKPTERPYANDNPNYLNNIENIESNYAFLNKALSGTYRSDWRVLQTNFSAEYDIPGIKGLTLKGVYSYYIADNVLNNHEFTYDVYNYDPATDQYSVARSITNPWREREQQKVFNTNMQAQLSYNNTFGKHTIGATLVAERIKQRNLRNWLHAIPKSNNLPLIEFSTMDRYDDSDLEQRRVGYIGRFNYNYANKYYLEVSARRDASSLFITDKRVGYFPAVSAGWRVTEESFMKNLLGENSILNDLKIRASYGIMGDDRNPNDAGQPIVGYYAFLPGYNYAIRDNDNNPILAILDDQAISVSRDKGIPVTTISWLKSKTTNIAADFSMFNSKLNGTIEYFRRVRSGLLASREDILLPGELGYALPQANLESDLQYGQELSLTYNNKIGQVSYSVGGNIAYTRAKWNETYKERFFNSWDQYRNQRQGRYKSLDWGHEVIGQFESYEQINNYPVNIDGKGNRTLIPGDLIYKDQNNDGKIDQYDERPIGFGYGTQPNINYGFNIALSYKNFDFHADFSGASGYTWFQNWETRWAFQNNGNLNTIFEDRWHRADIYDINSQWIPGKYPANRNNPGFSHSNYEVAGQRNSTFWLHNVKQLRARTLEIGYSLPTAVLSKIKIKRARFYVNGYNLFSFDNLKEFGIDPEVVDDNGLQFPQNKVVNFGVNLTF